MSDWDKILASSPVNATAAAVTGKGTAFEPRVTILDWYPDMPELAGEDHYNGKNPAAGFIDFRGRKVGQLVVIGIMVKSSAHERASWVCRCKCGCFCSRKAKSLKVGLAGGNSFVPVCGMCDYQNKLRGGWAPDLSKKMTVRG